MATTTWACNKDARIANNGSNLGAGASDFNPVGTYSGYEYETLLGFAYSFTGMTTITSAILHFRTSTQYYVAFGSDPDVEVERITASWSEGTSVGLSGSNAVVWPGPTTAGAQPGGPHDIVTTESTWDTIDVTAIVNAAKSAGVFYGIKIRAATSSSTDVTEIYSREQGSSDPYIEVTYTTNVAPSAPVSLSPTGGGIAAGGATPVLAFTHSDSDGDALLDYDIQVSTDSTFASVTHWNIAAQTTGISGNNVARTYAGTALTRGVTYYWRARTSSAAGVLTEGAWSAAQSFKVNQLPTVTFVTPSAADALVEMVKVAGSGVNPRMVVRWTFSDPDGGAQKKYRVIALTDASGAFHDSGTITSSATSYTIPVDPTRAAFYRIEVIVTDQNDETATTGSRRCKANWGLAEYRIDLGATVTAWSASPTSTGGTNKSVVVEYAGSAAGTAITTWYSSLASAGLFRWFHWRVFLFAWSGATTPQMDKMSLTYTNSAAVPPDGWTITAQHALDTGTRVYGTQSLKVTCNGTSLNGYQLVPVEPNTDYILSARIKSDGNSGAKIILSTGSSSGDLVASTAVTATQDWGRVKTDVWNSGANSSVYVRVFANGAASTAAWFDAVKLEASSVVTPWTPGFVGSGVTIDVGGLQIDASPAGGAVMRLQGSSGGARDTVELGANGLLFGGDATIYSPTADVLKTDDTFAIGTGGFFRAGGTAFPSSPTAGDRFFRTDHDMDFEYDGTRWVCVCPHDAPFVMTTTTTLPVTATASDRWHAYLPVARGLDLLVESYDCSFLVVTGGSALSASHSWVGTIVSEPAGTTLATLTIDSGASSAWRSVVDTGDDSVDITGSQIVLSLTWTKTGTPGNLTFSAGVSYRYVL